VLASAPDLTLSSIADVGFFEPEAKALVRVFQAGHSK
jgi:hypothetical protein